MATTVANVLSGQPKATGGILHAPLGSTLPTDAATALDGAFVALGYAGESGVEETIGRTTSKVKAWGGDIVKVLQSDFSVTYKFTLIESLSAEVQKVVHGASNVTTTPATPTTGTLHEVLVKSDVLPHEAYAFEVKDGDVKIRIAVEDGQIIEVGPITYASESVIQYEVTLEAFKGATTGAQAVKYIDDGVFSV